MLFLLTSCDDDTYDHNPPDGKGSIVIENDSGSDTSVYINGSFTGNAKSRSATIFDLDPGKHRLVLAERDGYRNYRDDVDVLENRLTVLDVTSDYTDTSRYLVIIDFE